MGDMFSWKQRSDYSPGKSRSSVPSKNGNKGLPLHSTLPGNASISAGYDFPAQKGTKGAKLPSPPNVYEKEPPVRD